MKFDIVKDFLNSKKILCISGKSCSGKTKLAIDIVKALNISTVYIDTNNEINSINNGKLTLWKISNFNEILKHIEQLKGYYSSKKCIVVIDCLSTINFNSNFLSNNLKKFINILNKIQNESSIRFIVTTQVYMDLNNNYLKTHLDNSTVNTFFISSYKDLDNLKLKQQLLKVKLKNILE